LSPGHDCGSFDCGKQPLDEYIKKFALLNQKLGLSQCFVATTPPDHRVMGYYCISAGSVFFQNISEDLRKGLPRYPIPVCLIGRMAVDMVAQGRGLGETLLFDAFERIVRVADEVGIHAVEVQAKDADAKNFYLKYGFVELADDKLHLLHAYQEDKEAGACVNCLCPRPLAAFFAIVLPCSGNEVASE